VVLRNLVSWVRVIFWVMAALPAPACAKDIISQAPLSWEGGSGMVQLRIRGNTAALTVLNESGNAIPLRSVETVADALAILADERLAFAWPSLLEWAGDDLHLLRDRMLARAQETLEAQVHPKPPGRQFVPYPDEDPKAAAMRGYIQALYSSGDRPRAIALAQEQMRMPFVRDHANFARAQYAAILGGMLINDNRPEEAIAVLDGAASDESLKEVWRVNVDVNRAALLAITGDYSRALTAIERAEAKFDSQKTGLFAGLRHMPDSWAQFAWIRACALNGVGRRQEANAIISAIPRSRPTSVALPTTSLARLNGLECMHDLDGFGSELMAQLAFAPPAGDLFLRFQPATYHYSRQVNVVSATVQQAPVRNAMAGRVRTLGGAFASALSGWSSTRTAVN